MIDDIRAHREEVAAACQRFHVRRLDLFGSAARGVKWAALHRAELREAWDLARRDMPLKAIAPFE